MIVHVSIDEESWPGIDDARALVTRAAMAAFARLGRADEEGELCVVLASDGVAAELNARWRGKNRPTNVLSFPAPAEVTLPPGTPPHLGDIILAGGVVAREARRQAKPLRHHLVHLVVHGVLHVLGYDHIEDRDAARMERLESAILEDLGISDPYVPA